MKQEYRMQCTNREQAGLATHHARQETASRTLRRLHLQGHGITEQEREQQIEFQLEQRRNDALDQHVESARIGRRQAGAIPG